jgi:hypothetical protein
MSGRDDDDDWAMQKASEFLMHLLGSESPYGVKIIAAELRLIREQGIGEGIARCRKALSEEQPS